MYAYLGACTIQKKKQLGVRMEAYCYRDRSMNLRPTSDTQQVRSQLELRLETLFQSKKGKGEREIEKGLLFTNVPQSPKL